MLRTESPWTVPYRPDIDGLRGIAVLAVLGFHTAPTYLRGGFVGVDVFFVISGYLITRILLRAMATGSFRFGHFYGRRIKRLFPALLLVLAAALGLGWLCLAPEDYRQLGKHVLASAAFVPNLIFWSEAGYFDLPAGAKPLLHMWSLGVEEQFYLVWPFALYAAYKRSWNPLALCMCLLVASFAVHVIHHRPDPVGAFYSPVPRFWELMSGAALACAPRDGALFSRLRSRACAILPARLSLPALAAATGLALVTTSLFLFDGLKILPVWWSSMPVVGSALIIAAGPSTWINRNVLAHRVAVWIGLISFPLYLWHWLLLSFARISEYRFPAYIPSRSVAPLALVASVLLAWITYRLVERPARFGPRARSVVTMSCVLLGLVATLAFCLYHSDGFPDRRIATDERAQFLRHYERLHLQGLSEAYRAECDFFDWTARRRKASIDAGCTRQGTRATLFLWGDSHAQALSYGLRQILPGDVALAQVATSGCAPGIRAAGPSLADACDQSNAYALDAIGKLKPSVLIVAQSEGHESVDWLALTRHVRDLGVRWVLLVGPAPRWRPSLPLVVAQHYWGTGYRRVARGLDVRTFASDLELSQRYRNVPGLTYVSLVKSLCDENGCLATASESDRDLMFVDYGHLSIEGSAYVAREILGPVIQTLAPFAAQP